MPVVQCPRCDLRFTTTTELDDHLEREHPRFDAEDRHGDESRREEERRRLHVRKTAREIDPG